MQTSSKQTDVDLLARLTAPAASQTEPPRLLLALAHPDDEVLAMGARLERLTHSRLITVTDGAPLDGSDARHHGFYSLEKYRQGRKQELLEALADAGLEPSVAPDFPQQCPDQTVSLHLVELSRALVAELEKTRPDAVLTHAYEGGHPDHDACAYSVHAAARLYTSKHGLGCPIIEAPFYRAGANGAMETGTFLPHADGTATLTYELTPAEQDRKAVRLACFRSQAETLAQFDTVRESFRFAPRYDFSQRPHAGALFYEQFPWGMDGDRFCALASAANDELFGPAADFRTRSEHKASL